MGIKGKVTKDGFVVEFEATTSYDFTQVVNGLITPKKSNGGRPAGSKTVNKASTSVKYFTGKNKRGAPWSPRDIKIAADTIVENNAKGVTHGTKHLILQRLKAQGDNRKRTEGAVGMTVMEIKRHMAGRSEGVSNRIANMLSQQGFGKSTKRDLIEA